MAEGNHNICDSHMQVKEEAEEEKLQNEDEGMESSGTTEANSESSFDQIVSWEAYEEGMLSKIEQSNRVHAKCMNSLTKESELSEFYKKNGKIDPETNDNSDDDSVQIILSEDIKVIEITSSEDDDSVQMMEDLNVDIYLVVIRRRRILDYDRESMEAGEDRLPPDGGD
ncbi:uncharacterized protein LOC6565603 [Drosophila grimshawi]|nr:uncharacterized protein LOC6565603 [Drosophila grimshawi]XP_043072054.1 uncharacterized protein LOC6565603 [Drosophila grimshawi]